MSLQLRACLIPALCRNHAFCTLKSEKGKVQHGVSDTRSKLQQHFIDSATNELPSSAIKNSLNVRTCHLTSPAQIWPSHHPCSTMGRQAGYKKRMKMCSRRLLLGPGLNGKIRMRTPRINDNCNIACHRMWAGGQLRRWAINLVPQWQHKYNLSMLLLLPTRASTHTCNQDQ